MLRWISNALAFIGAMILMTLFFVVVAGSLLVITISVLEDNRPRSYNARTE